MFFSSFHCVCLNEINLLYVDCRCNVYLNLFSCRLFFLIEEPTNIQQLYYVYWFHIWTQHTVVIMVLSVHHDHILLEYTIMVYCSGSITPRENMSKHISRKICQGCGYITSAYCCRVIVNIYRFLLAMTTYYSTKRI